MKTRIILFACFFSSPLLPVAQSGLIRCTTQNNNNGTVSIYSSSDAFGEYTVKIVFAALNGFSSRSMITSDIALATVNRGYNEAVRLTREPTNTGPVLQYRYYYYPGRALAGMPDTSFEYLLPATAGNHIKITLTSATTSNPAQQLRTEYRGTGFSFKLNDTICASRAGTVLECSDTAREGEKMETVYRSGRNRLLVQHRDGTLGLYGITAPIRLLVRAGDEVFPGQPIAVLNKESDRYRIYFSVCYLDERKLGNNTGPENTQYYTYIPVVFCGSESERSSGLQVNKEYTVEHPKEIITAEMSRREKKKFGY